jgi:MerR family transcriptional regulator, light-induced transcriptional regulator
MAESNRDAVAERSHSEKIGRDDAGPEVQAAAHSAFATEGPECAEHLSQLVRTIETEIIPRLMLAHRADAEAHLSARTSAGRRQSADLDAFTMLLLEADDAKSVQYLHGLRDAGHPLDAIYLEVLAPAARMLGDMWLQDTCSFSEVTVGLSRLHRRVLELGPAFHSNRGTFQPGKSALLVAAPGEQHTFGLFMVTEFFRREGWEVSGDPIQTVSDLADTVQDHWFELVGISAGTAQRLEDVRTAVSAVRKASRNHSVAVMVGGPLFLENPDFATQIGADGFGVDAQAAVAKAEQLIRLSGIRPAT